MSSAQITLPPPLTESQRQLVCRHIAEGVLLGQDELACRVVIDEQLYSLLAEPLTAVAQLWVCFHQGRQEGIGKAFVNWRDDLVAVLDMVTAAAENFGGRMVDLPERALVAAGDARTYWFGGDRTHAEYEAWKYLETRRWVQQEMALRVKAEEFLLGINPLYLIMPNYWLLLTAAKIAAAVIHAGYQWAVELRRFLDDRDLCGAGRHVGTAVGRFEGEVTRVVIEELVTSGAAVGLRSVKAARVVRIADAVGDTGTVRMASEVAEGALKVGRHEPVGVGVIEGLQDAAELTTKKGLSSPANAVVKYFARLRSEIRKRLRARGMPTIDSITDDQLDRTNRKAASTRVNKDGTLRPRAEREAAVSADTVESRIPNASRFEAERAEARNRIPKGGHWEREPVYVPGSTDVNIGDGVQDGRLLTDGVFVVRNLEPKARYKIAILTVFEAKLSKKRLAGFWEQCQTVYERFKGELLNDGGKILIGGVEYAPDEILISQAVEGQANDITRYLLVVPADVLPGTAAGALFRKRKLPGSVLHIPESSGDLRALSGAAVDAVDSGLLTPPMIGAPR